MLRFIFNSEYGLRFELGLNVLLHIFCRERFELFCCWFSRMSWSICVEFDELGFDVILSIFYRDLLKMFEMYWIMVALNEWIFFYIMRLYLLQRGFDIIESCSIANCQGCLDEYVDDIWDFLWANSLRWTLAFDELKFDD